MSSLLIIDATITVGAAILAEAGLTYLGFGVQQPDVSLGMLIASGQDSVFTLYEEAIRPVQPASRRTRPANRSGHGI